MWFTCVPEPPLHPLLGYYGVPTYLGVRSLHVGLDLPQIGSQVPLYTSSLSTLLPGSPVCPLPTKGGKEDASRIGFPGYVNYPVLDVLDLKEGHHWVLQLTTSPVKRFHYLNGN